MASIVDYEGKGPRRGHTWTRKRKLLVSLPILAAVAGVTLDLVTAASDAVLVGQLKAHNEAQAHSPGTPSARRSTATRPPIPATPATTSTTTAPPAPPASTVPPQAASPPPETPPATAPTTPAPSPSALSPAPAPVVVPAPPPSPAYNLEATLSVSSTPDGGVSTVITATSTANGSPDPGATVTFSNPACGTATATTDPSGTARVTLACPASSLPAAITVSDDRGLSTIVKAG